jgi:hypothetical protein
MARREESRKDYVMRAAAATKMADSCREPALRDSLFELAEEWLDRADEMDDGPPAGSRLQ